MPLKSGGKPGGKSFVANIKELMAAHARKGPHRQRAAGIARQSQQAGRRHRLRPDKEEGLIRVQSVVYLQ